MMDEKYAQLLETLATKLGTTAEHLWGVLLRQAPISGAVDLALCIILAAVAWKLIALVKRKTADPESEWRFDPLPAVFFALVATILSGVALLSIPGIVSAFANPEYWALKQLLSMVPR
jgi:hypothetical protein